MTCGTQELCVFQSLDKGGAEQLTFEDVRELLQNENPGLAGDEEALKQEFARIDGDKDGILSKTEFLAYFFDIGEATKLGVEVTKAGLAKASVFARLRPRASEGGYKDENVACSKKLEKFTEKALWVSGKKYDFPSVVLTPEKSQQEVYDTIMPVLVDAWVQQCQNVMFFAYGQTGTGKTHTMFGTSESLQSSSQHEDWGLFPRVVDQCLKRLEAVKEGWKEVKYVLTASALEFYCCRAFDLLYQKTPVIIDKDCKPVGMNYMVLDKVSDLATFVEEVYGNRTVKATKMNAGSSRSHVALILTLHQFGDDPTTDPPKKDQYTSTTFTMMDLAGSERVSKTGAERMSGMEAIMTVAKGGDIPTGAQATLINFELSALSSEVIIATEQHTKGKVYKAPKSMSTDTIKFAGGCFEGKALLGMVICISQASQNGWETWFSCEMASKLAQLKAPSGKEKIRNLHKEYAAALKVAEKAQREFETTPEKGSPASKFYSLRKGAAHGARRYCEILETLGAKVSG
ncbi:hypothetical protein CYMTET_55672 [Cymbomonas tetramitiformis]|uniref:Kinesin-like protein n=1 Tax=Cymbomonas tetramitiformis TaxID=36881 RepID=A0AAE0EN50_9CHLO|nr:hypothetical protein CYMTET_55672 [Cymbomonas tetramitiformis]